MKPHAIATVATMLALSAIFAKPVVAQSPDAFTTADRWQWRATSYAWFPNFRSTTNFSAPGGATISVDTDPGRYLRNLEFAYMGSLEARKGPWSFVGDAIVVDFDKGNSNVTSIRTPAGDTNLPVPASAHAELKAFVGTLAAGYSIHRSSSTRVDVVGGARYMRVKASFDGEFSAAVPGLPPKVHVERSKDIWDGIVGLRGSTELGDRWFAPFHVDVGTGDSRFTWQAFAGVGYHFAWGDAMVGYRHMRYEFRSAEPVSDLTFSGPVLGVAFRF